MKVDPERLLEPKTGIYVRAEYEGAWANADIAHLDRDSLMAWLRSRGGDNPWAENTVAILLGHGPEGAKDG
jgi:hypothetical protein